MFFRSTTIGIVLCCFTALVAAGENWPEMSVFHLPGKWTNHRGEPVSLDTLGGKPAVLAMVYTSCQYSCPLVTSKVGSVKSNLPENLASKVTYALVSFDPERDTPGVLTAYKEKMKLDNNWVLLTGDESSVRNLAAALGVNYKKMADGEFSHSNVVILLNKNGEVVSRLDTLNSDISSMSETITTITQ